MNATASSKNRLLVLATSTILILALVLLASFMSIAGAQSEPNKEPFAGVLVDAPAGQENNLMEPVNLNALGPEWRPIFIENFDSGNWENKWDVNLDYSGAGYKWGTRNVPNSLDPQSTSVVWAIGGGPNGTTLDPIASSYPDDVNSWLVAGPFNLSNAKDALMNMDLLFDANQVDSFQISVSEDRFQFVPQFTVNQGTGQWEQKTVSLSSYIGKPQVWIAFIFDSGSSAQKLSVMMDNVSIWTEGEAGIFMPYIAYGFTPTPIPVTPTATPPPGGGDFEQNFTNRIDPWEVRRWSNNTSYSIGHDDSTDGDYQGFLNLKVTKEDSYVIASPLVAGPSAPYNIESVIKLRSPRETDQQYGIIFGGNYIGGNCPVTDFSSCFTEYYEMRVRFYYDELDDKDRMDMKLKRIDNHDANNNNSGPDLIDWTRVSSVDENDFIEWDITVEANGKIKISANDKPVKDATDSTYINNPYFGFIVRNGSDVEDAEARFDYIKINSLD